MAPAASDFHIKFNPTPLKRSQIKVKIFNIIAKPAKDLATVVAGKKKKGDYNGGGRAAVITVDRAGKLKSASERKIKRNGPRRGEIKIKIFKMIAKSVQNLAIRVTGCISSPATVTPMDTAGEP